VLVVGYWSSYKVVGCWLLGLLMRLLVVSYWVFLRGCWLLVIRSSYEVVGCWLLGLLMKLLVVRY
jgi:hypothetical protein